MGSTGYCSNGASSLKLSSDGPLPSHRQGASGNTRSAPARAVLAAWIASAPWGIASQLRLEDLLQRYPGALRPLVTSRKGLPLYGLEELIALLEWMPGKPASIDYGPSGLIGEGVIRWLTAEHFAVLSVDRCRATVGFVQTASSR